MEKCRLFVRIVGLGEARAEGALAILVISVLAVAILAAQFIRA